MLNKFLVPAVGTLMVFVCLLGFVVAKKYAIQPTVVTTMEFQDDSDLLLTSFNN